MRPSIYDIIAGIIQTWDETILPIVLVSGQEWPLREMKMGSILLHRLAASWDTEGENYFQENNDMRQALRQSLPAFRRAGMDAIVSEIEREADREYYPKGGYPPLKALMEENYCLKETLDTALVAIAGVKRQSKALQNVHINLRKVIKRQLSRDLSLRKVMQSAVSQNAAAKQH